MFTEVTFEIGDFYGIHDHIIVIIGHIGKSEPFKRGIRVHPGHRLRMGGNAGELVLVCSNMALRLRSGKGLGEGSGPYANQIGAAKNLHPPSCPICSIGHPSIIVIPAGSKRESILFSVIPPIAIRQTVTPKTFFLNRRGERDWGAIG
jgi:hypothetical protein